MAALVNSRAVFIQFKVELGDTKHCVYQFQVTASSTERF